MSTESKEIYMAYAEAIGRSEFEENHSGELLSGATQPWSSRHPMYRTYLRAGIRRTKALAAAGLLPNTRLSRVHPCDCQPCPECETAALAQGSVRQHRYATAWIETHTITPAIESENP